MVLNWPPVNNKISAHSLSAPMMPMIRLTVMVGASRGMTI